MQSGISIKSQNQSPTKPKLIPVKVPWRIALATPFLKLTFEEFESTQVEFVARFQSENDDEEEERVVTATFNVVWCLRGGTAPEDGHSPIDESSYDWSEVDHSQPNLELKMETLDDWFQQFNQEWKTSKICPDPGMYEVHGSDWSAMAQSDAFDYTHFLIVGETRYVEILCRTWSWTAGEVIDWWGEST